MAYRRRRKKTMEFSKKLAIIITVLFIGTWFVGWVTWFISSALPERMLDFITMPFSVVITGYFAKSGVENYTKIKGSSNEYEDVQE